MDRSVSGECSCFFKMIWGWSRQLDSYISGLPVYVTLCMSQIQGGQVKLLSQREIRTLQNCLRYSKKIIMKKPSAPRSDVRGLIPPMKFVSLLYFMSETTCDFFSTDLLSLSLWSILETRAESNVVCGEAVGMCR